MLESLLYQGVDSNFHLQDYWAVLSESLFELKNKSHTAREITKSNKGRLITNA